MAGAAWPHLHRLIDAGRLPTIATLVETGCSAQLQPDGLTPHAFWATAATGVPPSRHGITGPLDVRTDGGGVQPIGAGSWRAPPVWQLLADAGIATAVIGWPGLVPATAWPGVAIDERFARPAGSLLEDWPLPPRCITPPTLREDLRDLRIHPEELVDAECDGIPPPALAAAATLQAASALAAAGPEWRMLAVFQPLLSLAPLDAALLFLDAALAHLIAVAGPGTDVLLVSECGVLVAAGPAFAVDQTWHRAAAADVAATILARFGLRIEGPGRDLSHRPPAALHLVEPGTPPARPGPPPAAPPAPTAEAARLIAAVQRDTRIQGATAALAAGDHQAAAALLEAALASDPSDDDARSLLGQCRFFLGDWAGCRFIGEALVRTRPESPWGAMMVGAALALGGDHAAAAPHLAEAGRRAGTNAEAHVRLGAVFLHLGDTAAARVHYGRALALDPELADAYAGLGLASLAAGDLPQAERHLLAALGQRFHAPALHHQLGLLYASQGRFTQAYNALRIALDQYPGLPGAVELLRRVEQSVFHLAIGHVGAARDRAKEFPLETAEASGVETGPVEDMTAPETPAAKG